MAEVLPPVIMTDVYIFLSWLAFFAEEAHWCLMLVGLSFLLYFWASYDMILWIISFSKASAKRGPDFYLRVGLTIGLIIVFALYGLVYLLGTFGVITTATEDLVYTSCDVFVKMVFVLSLYFLHIADNRSALTNAMHQLTSLNMAQESLLRGNFDIVLNCTLRSDGTLQLPSEGSTDLRKLEHGLNMKVANSSINELITSTEQQRVFKKHILSTLDRLMDVEATKTDGQYVAVSQTLNCELTCKDEEMEYAKCLAVVHLSGTCIGGLIPHVGHDCATSLVAISLQEPQPEEDVGQVDAQMHTDSSELDEANEPTYNDEVHDEVPLLPSMVAGSDYNEMEGSDDGDSLCLSDGTFLSAVTRSAAGTTYTGKTGRSCHGKRDPLSPKRQVKRKVKAKMVESGMQTEGESKTPSQYVSVAVQTQRFRSEHDVRPPRPGGEILPGGAPGRSRSPALPRPRRSSSRRRQSARQVSHSDQGSIHSCSTTASDDNNIRNFDVRNFDGVWMKSNESEDDGDQLKLHICNGNVLYIYGGNEPERTHMEFVASENVWYLLGGALWISPDGNELLRTGKAGSQYKFERAHALAINLAQHQDLPETTDVAQCPESQLATWSQDVAQYQDAEQIQYLAHSEHEDAGTQYPFSDSASPDSSDESP
jgi:hypothetical protein